MANYCMDCVVCVDVLEHVSDLCQVLDEVTRVLRPGGVFLFDTINRTWLAQFVIVFLGEKVLRLLPRGTHDPEKFIRPEALVAALAARGFAVGALKGLGPVGVNRRLDIHFGEVPLLSAIYMGHAIRSGSARGGG